MRLVAVCGIVALIGLLLFTAFDGLGGVAAYAYAQQADLHRALVGALKAVDDDPVAAGATLIALSFGYGVLHAAGPGHGKAVIAAYVGTHRARLPQIVALCAGSALLQGASAIAVVAAIVAIAGLTARDAQAAAAATEKASFALVIALGALLTLRVARALWGRRTVSARGVDASDSIAVGAACATCGHAHAPDPRLLDHGWRDAAAVVVAIGVRPCTGAVLVLIVASVLDLWAAGVAAVLAMSVGTGLTVTALAAFTLSFRRTAAALLRRAGVGGGETAALGVSLCGGVALCLLGGALLAQSFAADHPLF